MRKEDLLKRIKEAQVILRELDKVGVFSVTLDYAQMGEEIFAALATDGLNVKRLSKENIELCATTENGIQIITLITAKNLDEKDIEDLKEE